MTPELRTFAQNWLVLLCNVMILLTVYDWKSKREKRNKYNQNIFVPLPGYKWHNPLTRVRHFFICNDRNPHTRMNQHALRILLYASKLIFLPTKLLYEMILVENHAQTIHKYQIKESRVLTGLIDWKLKNLNHHFYYMARAFILQLWM